MSLAEGSEVGGFRIKRLVGVGATGEIYQAVDERLGRKVALKLLRPAVVDDKTVQRFIDEARTTARLSHPHVVTVYAAGTFQTLPWIAFEFLDGASLRGRLDAGSMSPREAMRLIKAVCEGVAEAHRHQIIHADLKPENVIVPSDGRLRVLDFGLARLMGSSPAAASGTPAYMAPERWAGKPPTPAMDVWAIGVMLHELIEGSRPLTDSALAAYAFSPTELALGPKVAAQPCASLIARCLAPQPDQRPPVDEMALQLTAMLDGVPSSAEERAPFRGLDAFSEADAADLQGREADIDAFIELLRRQSLVPLTGPSGIGKSSFLHAGVIPRLREQDRWTVVRCRPGSRPLWSLANALVNAAPLGASARAKSPPPSVEEVLTTLTERPGSLEAFVTRLGVEQSSRVLLVVDQFEELFTLASPAEAKTAVEALRCVASVEATARVVLSVRDDFLSTFAALPELREFLGAITVLPALGRAALAEAVSAPLRRVRYFTDSPELANRIATELEGQPSALPLLQFAARALWERRDTERRLVLTREYEAMGKAAGALASHAQRFLSDALPEERELTRELMLRLVNEASTRRPRGRSELLQGLAPRAEVVLSRLLAHRLLVSGRPAEREEAQIELAHESLVSNWPALTRWLAETHEARRLSGEIEQAAALWVSRGRRDEETWAGSAVQQAFSRASEWKLTLSQTQQEFLEAGRRREVARVKRRRRAFIGAFSGVTALAMLSTGAAYAFRQKQLETLAQQKEITLAAADMGQVTLSLEPFDWSPETLTATPAGLPKSLEWKLHAPDIKALDQPGREYTGADLIRHGASVVDGHLREALEVRSGPAFLEVLGRGSKGERCGSSWVSLKRLPGYSERGSESVLAVPVPTCQASRSGLVRVPAGPYLEPAVSDTEPGVRAVVGEFWLSRTEALRADYEPYHRLHALTGDELPVIPAALDPPADPRLPIVALTARAAERYCGFWGLRLPSLDEWQKAYRGGLELPSGPNPAPSRVVLCEGPKCANIADAFDEPHLAVSGSFPLDVSPYGHLDLMGNVSEWTSTVQSAGRYAGLRTVTGGNWSFPASQRFHQVNKWNTRTPEYIDFSLGVRCAGDGER